jgi:hypothetical protein
MAATKARNTSLSTASLQGLATRGSLFVGHAVLVFTDSPKIVLKQTTLGVDKPFITHDTFHFAKG